jgi:hypothetical protein
VQTSVLQKIKDEKKKDILPGRVTETERLAFPDLVVMEIDLMLEN